jgi:hypothetical protein
MLMLIINVKLVRVQNISIQKILKGLLFGRFLLQGTTEN